MRVRLLSVRPGRHLRCPAQTSRRGARRSRRRQPPPQQPVFRAGVDLLTVDATVVDRDGRQIIDLQAGEFVGRGRRQRAAGRLRRIRQARRRHAGADRRAEAAAVAQAPPDDAFFSTNARARSTPGGSILLLVDQGNIRVGQGRQMMRSAVKFVDGLHADRSRRDGRRSRTGALVDFTTEHEKVREALLATVGLATPFKGRFNISLSEAIATVEHSDAMLTQADDPARVRGGAAVAGRRRALRDRGRTGSQRDRQSPAHRRRRPRCAGCAKC